MQVSKRKQYWSKISPDKKKKYMEPAMNARWKGVGAKKRIAHAKKMALARWGKIIK